MQIRLTVSLLSVSYWFGCKLVEKENWKKGVENEWTVVCLLFLTNNCSYASWVNGCKGYRLVCWEIWKEQLSKTNTFSEIPLFFMISWGWWFFRPKKTDWLIWGLSGPKQAWECWFEASMAKGGGKRRTDGHLEIPPFVLQNSDPLGPDSSWVNGHNGDRPVFSRCPNSGEKNHV